jgi:hypothetical protein
MTTFACVIVTTLTANTPAEARALADAASARIASLDERVHSVHVVTPVERIGHEVAA